MALKIEIALDAELDIRQIYVRSALDFGIGQAKSYRGEIEKAVELLALFPSIGVATHSGLRVFGVKSHCIFYEQNGDALKVLRILHTRQLPPGLD